MDLVHMATCSIRWAILWSTEYTKIKQNQVVHFDGLGVVRVKEGKYHLQLLKGQYRHDQQGMELECSF